MYKNIVLLISLALLIGCSQTKVENDAKTIKQNQTTKKEAIPEHIRLSHIEVVPH